MTNPALRKPTSAAEQRAFLRRIIDEPTDFVQAVWDNQRLERYAPLGEVEFDMVQFLFDGPAHKVGLGPRSMGKTYLIAAIKPCWQLLRDPEWKGMLVSQSESTAKKTLHLIKDYLRLVWFLQHLHPRSYRKRNSTIQLDVEPAEPNRTPSITAQGIESQLEGGRAHEVIADDIETGNNTITRESRNALAKRSGEFNDIASYGKQEVTYIGTYHHEESLYLDLHERGYALRTWPIEYPTPDTARRIVNLAPLLRLKLQAKEARPGEPTMPHRLGRQRIENNRKEGTQRFAQQHMLIADLADEERYPLRLRNLIVFPVQIDKAPISIAWGTNRGQGQSTAREDIPSRGFGDDCFYGPIFHENTWRPYEAVKMKIDPSGSGQDDTAYAIGGLLNGYLYTLKLDTVKAQNGAGIDAMNELAAMARAYGVREIDVEQNFAPSFPTMLESVIQQYRVPEDGRDDRGNHYPAGWSAVVTTTHSHSMKEARIIDSIVAPVNNHRVIIDEKIAENPAFQRQFTRIRKERNCLEEDDEIDAFAGLIDLFIDRLNIVPDDAAEIDRTEERERHAREAQAFFDEIQNPGPPTWHSIA